MATLNTEFYMISLFLANWSTHFLFKILYVYICVCIYSLNFIVDLEKCGKGTF